MASFSINLIDVCNSSYFQGSSNETDCMMVDGTTTKAQVIEWLKRDAFDGAGDRVDSPDNVYELIEKAVSEYCLDITNIEELAFPSLEIAEEDSEWDCYAYFELVFEDDSED